MIFRITVLLTAILISGQALTAGEVQLKTKTDTLAYALGMDIGKNLTHDDLGLDFNAIVAGLKAGLEGDSTILNSENLREYLMALQKYVVETRNSRTLEENKKFFEENGKKPGVITTPSGLQYKVLQEGTGIQPKSTDSVTIHYHGTLLNGQVFDSSVNSGKPITYPLNGFIEGWIEGIQLMKEGAKYIFYIPSDLAYGERGAGGSIPPNTPLIFEVELIKVYKTTPVINNEIK